MSLGPHCATTGDIVNQVDLGREGGRGRRERERGGGGGGGGIFVVFVVERQTTKFLPTKQYHIVLGCGLVYCNDENFSSFQKFTAHKNSAKIPLYGT